MNLLYQWTVIYAIWVKNSIFEFSHPNPSPTHKAPIVHHLHKNLLTEEEDSPHQHQYKSSSLDFVS